MTLDKTPRLWRARPLAVADRRVWGDQTVLYVLASGETHALDEAASAVLGTLTEHPGTAATAEDWLQRLLRSSVEDDEPVLQEELAACEAALMLLEKLGVIEAMLP